MMMSTRQKEAGAINSFKCF